MAFADTREAAFWKDVSGQGNHWTPNNLDYRDSLIDSPANNFAVLNPLVPHTYLTLSEGNLQVYGASGVNFPRSYLGQALKVKTYIEVCLNYKNTYWTQSIGLMPKTTDGDGTASNNGGISVTNAYNGATSYAVAQGGSTLFTEVLSSASQGDILMLAFDPATGEVWFGRNGTWFNSGNPATGTNPSGTVSTSLDWFAVISVGNASELTVNCGADSTFSGTRPAGGNQDDNGIGDFAYAPPSGYLALCTANLPTPTIIDGSEHFNTVLWTGNGSHIDVGFDPDLLWYKARNTTSYGGIVDSIRGDDVYLQSYSTNADVTSSGLLVTDSTGFTPGSAFSSNDYVAWNWKAGGTAVSNTDGSITSQVSANVDAGFSIVEWTYSASNNTVGHGLGAPIDMIITKDRGSGASNWVVWHKDLGDMATGYYLNLNNTNASSAYSTLWGQSSASSTTFGQGSGLAVSGSQIAYCFANSDIIKVGSYTGNGSSDGPFVYTGFRPAWVMIKKTNSTSDWTIFDSGRNPYNTNGARLWANLSSSEGIGDSAYSLYSNGFKLGDIDGSRNASGSTYIYLAFAEHPFKYANAR